MLAHAACHPARDDSERRSPQWERMDRVSVTTFAGSDVGSRYFVAEGPTPVICRMTPSARVSAKCARLGGSV